MTASGRETRTTKKETDGRLRSRFRGAMLGMAASDALGTTLEFRPPGSFRPINDMAGGGPFNLKAGEWTDDTSMALCLAESLIEQRGFDPADQMDRYLRWYREGHLSSNGRCFDIGNTVRGALLRYEQTGDPYSGSTDPHSAGNGSIMRLAPVVLFYYSRPQMALERAADSSRTTHGAATAVDACRYMAALLLGALSGEQKAEILSPMFSPVFGYWQRKPLVPEIAEIAAGSFKTRQPPQIKGSGHVVRSLEAALWAFWHSNSFQEGCLMAANLGDDADTTAAVFGQLAGAYYGQEALPPAWVERLALRTTITSFADQLLTLGSQH